jgi:hypothetical protein
MELEIGLELAIHDVGSKQKRSLAQLRELLRQARMQHQPHTVG